MYYVFINERGQGFAWISVVPKADSVQLLARSHWRRTRHVRRESPDPACVEPEWSHGGVRPQPMDLQCGKRVVTGGDFVEQQD